MTMHKIFQNFRGVDGRVRWEDVRFVDSLSPLMAKFVQDGAIYYAMYAILYYILPP